MAGELAPAVSGDFAILGVEADDYRAGEGVAGVMQKSRVLDRCGADDDVVDAVVEIALDSVEIADAAAELQRQCLHRLRRG